MVRICLVDSAANGHEDGSGLIWKMDPSCEYPRSVDFFLAIS